MFHKLAFRLVNKRMLITAMALGVIILIYGLVIQTWESASPGFLLLGFGGGMWFNGIEQRKTDQKVFDDAYHPRGR